MPNWDPKQYQRFADERLRPGLDLMARIPPFAAKTAIDLGCGTGELTARLAALFPNAAVSGLDSSPAMLEKARALDNMTWIEGDIARFSTDQDASHDVVYTNAALQWLPDHAALFPKLLQAVRPGGVFACQMPNNYMEPNHRLMRAVAASGPWAEKLKSARGITPVARPDQYFDWLSPYAERIDLWETRYWHVLEGDNPVVEWMKGTGLRPYVERLEGAEREDFLAAYAEAMRDAFPRRADGTTLLPFPRLFMVAVRK